MIRNQKKPELFFVEETTNTDSERKKDRENRRKMNW